MAKKRAVTNRIRKNGEEHMPLSELRRVVKCRRSHSTIYAWCRNGVKGVKLDSVPVGGSLESSVEAYQRFLEELEDVWSNPKE